MMETTFLVWISASIFFALAVSSKSIRNQQLKTDTADFVAEEERISSNDGAAESER